MVPNTQVLHEGRNFRVCLTENNEIVKVIRANATNYKSALAYLQNEYDLSNGLNTTGIRKALRIGSFEQNPALFLEYVSGTPLKNTKKKYSIVGILKIALKVIEGIHILHKNNIIHKDLSPNNIIIDDKGDITLIDLGISSKVSQKQHHLGNPRHLEGTLKYISPEQTGRVNKVVDYRSDLYSLGVILYELFVDRTPFDFDDPIELVHAHIATMPIEIHRIKSTIPSMISDIVSKLLSKNAENRYQTALGLKYDLENCLEQLEKNQVITNFELGKKDRSGILRLPQKLYGREDEIESLLKAFERVSQGSKELLVVGGYSGVGKSALVNEVHKSISEKRAYFITGKYEQYQRTIPYFALRKAFAELISYWLLEDKNVLEKWKRRIENALGDLAQVVTEIIPELELLIGKPADVPKLEGEQYANRFNYVFGLFMNAICTSKNPLVIFIDDWQWVDSASLGLFKFLLADEQLKNVLFIAAYRDNEVDESHLFMQTLASIKESKITPVTQLTLKNLSSKNIYDWIHDALKQNNIDELVELVFAKTQGNAFFTSQFLSTLFDERLLKFDFENNVWKWDIKQIQSQNITDNVVDLMANKIQKLPSQTQEMLELGACVGASFKLSLLATISEQTEEACYKVLEEALLAGLILKINQNTYRFVHDRIQQATYGLLTEQKQKELHFAIGKIWLNSVSESEREDKLMNIISQLNFGLDLIQSSKEKTILLNLNIQAGKKAKSSIAYDSAYHHFEIAAQLIPDDAWQKQYKQIFELHNEWGEVAFLTNEKEKSADILELALQNASNNYDKAKIYSLRSMQYSSVADYSNAVAQGVAGLNLFGWSLPELSDAASYGKLGEQEFGLYLQTMTGKSWNYIGDRAMMQHEEDLKCAEIIGKMMDAIMLGVPHTFGFFTAKLINFSLEKGMSPFLPPVLICMPLLYATIKQYQEAYEVGEYALKLQHSSGAKAVEARAIHGSAYSSMLARPYAVGVERQAMCHQSGFETGDFVYSGYGLLVAPRYEVNLKLANVLAATEKANAFYKKSNNIPLLMINQLTTGAVLSLQGNTTTPASFSHEGFDEDTFVKVFTEASLVWIAVYKRYKLLNAIVWTDYEQAYTMVQERETWITLLGALDYDFKSSYYLYSGVTVSMLAIQQKLDKKEAEIILDECIAELELFKNVYEGNFAHSYYILLAQKAWMNNNVLDTMNYYDQAIRIATKYKFYYQVALANELATEFYISINKGEFAGLYLKQSINYYQLWGSDTKSQALEIKHKHIYRRAIDNHNKSTVHTLLRTQYASSESTKSSILDVEALLKASQTLSKEIHLERLVQRMLRILIENAGANKGFLFLNQKNELYLQGEIHANGNEKMLQNIPLREAKKSVPIRVINYVINSENILVSDDTTKDSRFSESTYIKENAIKSLLCLPITNKNKFIGLLYLENSLVEGAFSQDRVDLLSALASQIAISIENALLYENLESKVEERTSQLKEKNIVLAEQNHIIDSAHKKIRASITYAERIQQAILPQADRIQSMLPKSFVFFKPRDVVSGDFYWSSVVRDSQGNQKVIFATADCTGHGVPGAFMSMIGANLLTQIVNDKRMYDPGLILDLLHGGVKHLLQQDKNKNRDGMDISISSVDWKTKTLEYAGAKRPLYYVQDGEMKEVKGDVYPIGGLQRGINRRFTTQKVSFAESPIMAYTFSDGYPDQFGGEEMKKFMTKKFRNMLSDIADKSMEEQKEYLGNTFDAWKGTQRQIDDILVVGMRLE